APIARREVEERVALEIRRETQAEAQVVRPPRFLDRIDVEHAATGLLDDAEVHALEIPGAVQHAEVAVDGCRVERLARLRLQGAADESDVLPRHGLEDDLVDGLLIRRGCFLLARAK